MSRTRVVVAMSGGVDSSVTAALLQREGYDVVGITMRLWAGDEDGPRRHHPCCLTEDVNDAREVCQKLGIPHYVHTLEPEFQAYVIDYFVEEYSHGRTPNPCLACNHFMKFRLLLRKTLSLDAKFMATGHYARIEERRGKYHLLKGIDLGKDQSYVLYTLGQEELAHLLLPLGGYNKAEIRRLASEFGLPVAEKPDSQEICFIPDGDCRAFLSERLTQTPGDIVDISGRVLGRHSGIAGYTIGQRQGLGLASNRRLYVVKIDAARNSLVVGDDHDLFSDTLEATRVTWVSGEVPPMPLSLKTKIRYRTPEAGATVSAEGQRVKVVFSEPQRAITPGQAAVFYRGDEVMGGGMIESAYRRSQPSGQLANVATEL